MPSSDAFRTVDEINGAHQEAIRGAAVGAAKWGLVAAGAGMGAYFLSPVYRNLTLQYKTFLQVSIMTIGSAIEGDRRLRAYELALRHRDRQGKAMREREKARQEVNQMIEKLEKEEAEAEAALARGRGKG